MAELEEIVPRRDYKLQPQLRKKCTKCGGILTSVSYTHLTLPTSDLV